MQQAIMSEEERQTIQDELDYWNDDGIESRMDDELQRVMRVYAGTMEEESMWQYKEIEH